MEIKRTSAVELSYLIGRYLPVDIPPCRVCGEALSISSMGGGEATRYHCSSEAADFLSAGAKDRENGERSWQGPLEKVASEHRERSEVRVSFHGDSRIAGLLAEYRALRRDLGEEMEIPLGAVHYPNGHGKHRCYLRAVHRGGDKWQEEYDWDYTHDPTHQELEVSEES